MPVLQNVTFCYMKLQNPVTKYQSTDKEFTVDCVISKAEAKLWAKTYSKQKPKVIDNDEFEGIFKIKPPFPEQEEQYVIKLKKDAQYKDGKPLPEEYHPKVLVKQANGKLKNIAKTTLVSNGSVGCIEFEEISNDYGVFAKLRNVRVDTLLEYKNSATSSELGDIEEDDEISSSDPSTSLGNVEEDEPVAQEPKKASKKASKPVDDEDEDSPF